MNELLRQFVKERRKKSNLTQQELAYKAGVGLRFVRDLEQGKQELRLDKVNQVLRLFNYQVGPVPIHSEVEPITPRL
jgi:y4mF family transcriptional regulator